MINNFIFIISWRFGFEATWLRCRQFKRKRYFARSREGQEVQQEMDPPPQLPQLVDHEPRLCCRLSISMK